MKPIGIPVVSEGETPYLPMPSGMEVYVGPLLPEPEEISPEARAILSKTREALANGSGKIDIGHLGPEDGKGLARILGEGEVGIRAGETMIQESRLTGVWQVADSKGGRRIEVGAFPEGVIARARAFAKGVRLPENLPDGLMNAPSVIAELMAKSRAGRRDVVNLTLLPMSYEDMAFIESMLGAGGVTMLSRGYGNCRISSTRLPDVWWVRYYNSQDALILDTIEIVDLPEAVRAAPEDIEDSLWRLAEILEWVGI